MNFEEIRAYKKDKYMKLKILSSSSKANGYILQSGVEKLIIECGVNIKEILKGLDFSIEGVVGCLISHQHL